MPLFIARAFVQTMIEIPVVAEDERAALEYLNSTSEWKADSGFDGAEESAISVAGVDRIVMPQQTPLDWDNDCLCWNGEDTELAHAFFGEEIRELQPKCDGMSDEECEKAWDDYFDKKEGLDAKFAADRKTPNVEGQRLRAFLARSPLE